MSFKYVQDLCSLCTNFLLKFHCSCGTILIMKYVFSVEDGSVWLGSSRTCIGCQIQSLCGIWLHAACFSSINSYLNNYNKHLCHNSWWDEATFWTVFIFPLCLCFLAASSQQHTQQLLFCVIVRATSLCLESYVSVKTEKCCAALSSSEFVTHKFSICCVTWLFLQLHADWKRVSACSDSHLTVLACFVFSHINK